MTNHKVALITGAGSGIGRAVAQALGAKDYALVLAGRRRLALDETAEMINTPEVQCIPSDVSKPESVSYLFNEIRRIYGRLDLLFNNAGISAPDVRFEDLSFQHWQGVMKTNLDGAFLCGQQAFKMMKEQQPQGGRIINNGSISAQVPRPNSAPYTASKHAITGLTKSMALDGRKYKIACGQIDIGNAASEMTRKMKKGVPQANGSTAVEPTMGVRHVADAVTYMANLPLDANVFSLTIMATGMPFVGRG